MNIALYGYGKMGKAIERAALERGHQVVLRVDHGNAGTPPLGADVAIEFSTPHTALANMGICLAHGVPVVVGTTGWYAHLEEIRALVKEKNGSLLWASNFSIGVNLFFTLNKYLAGLMDGQRGYTPQITEIHHIHKLDSPSGTAISLANGIAEAHRGVDGWLAQDGLKAEKEAGEGGGHPVPIASQRIGEVPGTHEVCWESAGDRITIKHEAFGREGFAMGAVVAAEWLQGRKGLFSMADVLGQPQ